jgi:hypothetical protein
MRLGGITFPDTTLRAITRRAATIGTIEFKPRSGGVFYSRTKNQIGRKIAPRTFAIIGDAPPLAFYS